MTMREDDTRRKSRRDLLLVLLILLLGILCVCLTGQFATRLAPTWMLPADMGSNLDPNADFAAQGNPLYFEPLSSGILTPLAWGDLFLTPGAYVPPAIVSVLPTQTQVTAPPFTQAPATKVPPTAVPPTGIPPTGGGPTSPPSTNPPPTNPSPPTATNTLTTLSADLSIAKTDGSGVYIPGNPITYTITVTNNGPDNATGFNITDTIPAAINVSSITCTTNGTASCGTNGSSGNNLSFTSAAVNAGAGTHQIIITLSGTVVCGTSGILTNTATVSVPAGYTDPNTGNNSAPDSDTQAALSADLSIAKTDGSDVYTPGNPITYTITVTNNGPDNASCFDITDTVPAAINVSSITCSTTGTASCGTNESSGNNLSFTSTTTSTALNAGAGNQITIIIDGTVAGGTSGTLMNTATVSVPAGYTDSNPGNNLQTDIDGDSTEPDIGPPDGYWFDLPAGGDLIFDLGSAGINFNGNPDSAYDLVYFERYFPDNFNPQDVRMDCVQVQIGRNNSPPYDPTNDWYTIFFWCDGTPDTNTNVDINVIGGNEDDNRIFLPGSLYGIPIPPYNAPPYNSGVTIDVHAPLVAAGAPNGNYQYLRIFSPALGDGDASNIDSIYVCPSGGC